MKIYILRHAKAEERDSFVSTQKPDSLRPLTIKGIKKLRNVCNFLKLEENHIDLFLISPFMRTLQTGDVLKEFYPDSKFENNKLLEPDGSKKQLLNKINKLKVNSICLIGHEPDLSELVTVLLSEKNNEVYHFKKSGLALIERQNKKKFSLRWLLTPKYMIRLQSTKYFKDPSL